jgi:CspA family cold shock protein
VASLAALQPNDNIYVSGLPLESSEEFVRQLFSNYGVVVSCKVMPPNGRSDCVALVRLADEEQAQWLCDNLNQNIPVGLTIPVSVRFAKPAAEKSAGSFAPAASGKGGDQRASPYGVAPPPVLPRYSGNVPDSWKSLVAPPAPKAAPKAAVGPPAVEPTVPVASPALSQSGIVKAWYEARGMGFITPASGGEDIFVHRTAIVDGKALAVGSTVNFEPSWDARKGKLIAKTCKGAIAEMAPGNDTIVADVTVQGLAAAVDIDPNLLKAWGEELSQAALSADTRGLMPPMIPAPPPSHRTW